MDFVFYIYLVINIINDVKTYTVDSLSQLYSYLLSNYDNISHLINGLIENVEDSDVKSILMSVKPSGLLSFKCIYFILSG